jgi:rubrerythrin
MDNNPEIEEKKIEAEERPAKEHIYFCDRCGFKMIERNCKVICPNCGNRFDCSDLSIYFD